MRTRPPCSRPVSFTQHVISEYLDDADWKAQIDTFRGVYRERRDAMLTALDDYLPDLSWTNPARRVLRLGHAARQPRLQVDAAARGQGARRVHARAPPSSPTAAAATRCGCRSATRPRSPSARASAGSSTVINGELELLDDLRRRPAPLPVVATGARPTATRLARPRLMHRERFSSSRAASPTNAMSRCARAAASPTACSSTASRSSCAIRTPPSCATFAKRARMWSGPLCTARAVRTGRCAACSTSSASPTWDRARTRRAWPGTSRPPRRSSHEPECARRHRSPSRATPSASSAPTAILEEIADEFSGPLVVKPAQGGSAQGVTIVEDRDLLPRAMVDAYTYWRRRPRRAEDHRYRDRHRHHRHRRRPGRAAGRRDRAAFGRLQLRGPLQRRRDALLRPGARRRRSSRREPQTPRSPRTRPWGSGTSPASTSSSTGRARRGSSRPTCCPASPRPRSCRRPSRRQATTSAGCTPLSRMRRSPKRAPSCSATG